MSEIIASGIVQKGTLQQYIDVFTPLVDEGKLHFNDAGLEFRVVDPANVASIIPGRLDASAFESYESPGSVTQGVDLNRLEDMISPADSGDLIELSIDMETRFLNIRFDNVDTDMGLIDPDAIRKEPDEPDFDLPNEITVEGRDFDRAVTVGDMVSDHIGIRGLEDSETAEFFAEGDIDETTVTLEPDDRIDNEQVKAVESLFSLEYLKDFAKPIPDDAEVTVRFGREFPIMLEWGAAGGAIEVTQLLAPRIQSD